MIKSLFLLCTLSLMPTLFASAQTMGVLAIGGQKTGTAGSDETNLSLSLVTDCWPEETTWVIQNDANETIFEGGPYYNQPLTQITESFWLETGNYTFTIYDAAGDGLFGTQWGNLCAQNGNFELVDAAGDTLLSDDGSQNFDSLSVSFAFDATVGLGPDENELSWNLYPNPCVSDFWLQFDAPSSQPLEIQIIDSHGAIISHHSVRMQPAIQVQVEDLPVGIYSIRVFFDGYHGVKRLIKSH